MTKLLFNLFSKAKIIFRTKKVRCLLCNRQESMRLNQFSFNNRVFSTVRCKNDGMIYLQPQPSASFYNYVYKKLYHSSCEESLSEQLTLDVNNNLARRKQDAKIRVDEIEELKPPGNLLELGCGSCLVLKEARSRGWRVEGVEISDYYRNLKILNNISVHFGDFLKINLKKKNYDVIALYSLLEHLTNSRAYLKKIRQLLKKDGILILRLPNTPPAGPKLALLSHVYHFTPKTITCFLENNGFKIEKIDTNVGAYKSSRYNTELRSMNIVARLESSPGDTRAMQLH